MGNAEPRVIDFLQIPDPRGAIVVGQKLPFPVARFFFLTSGVREVERGGHAHKTLEQMLVCTSGLATAEANEQKFVLRDHLRALYLPPMTWLDLTLFARSTVLVLASAEYDESDYIRDRSEFMALA